MRRAHNAKTPLERHLAAYFFWEAGLKLLASVAIVEYAEKSDPDPDLTERLKNLARPSVGHWWEFVRRLVPVLAESDEGFRAVRDLVLGRSRADLPRAAGLAAALAGSEEGEATSRATVRLTEMFDQLVTYRNRETGHGATGQRPSAFYERMARALTGGLSQVFEKVDVLAGRRLIFVDDVRRLASGEWQVDRYELIGEAARRSEPLTIPESQAVALPRPQRVYLERGPGTAPDLRCLHPLICYQPDTGKVFFLNSRRGKHEADYLCYDGGDTLRQELGADHRALLAQVLGKSESAAEEAERAASDVPQAAEAVLSPAERTIGEFELLSRLGRGGMGVVYRAWQPSLSRQVALKCMLKSGDPKAESRFAREIRALGRVEHPNVVKVYTSGAEGDQWFYVMELVEGAELAGVCEQLVGRDASAIDETSWRNALTSACAKVRSNEAPLTESRQNLDRAREASAVDEAPAGRDAREDSPYLPAPGGLGYVRRIVEIVKQVADAAHALHEAGVVHRDIKPGNIMLTSDGRTPVLMDLGLAQLADEVEGRLTKTRQFIGTLRYASPEQVLSAGRVDRRTDVYSLGATLWELLTLRPLFGATDETPTPELMLRIQSTDPEGPRRFNPNVPRDLEAIVLKCLEKDRARRYATSADLAADLGRFLGNEPVTAQPASLSYVASKFVRRHKVPLGVAAAVLLLLVGGTIAAFIRVSAERQEAVAARLREGQEKDKVQKALVDLTKSQKESEIVWNVVNQAYSSVKEENIRHLAGLGSVQEELAAFRLEGLKQLATASPDDPTVAPKLARAHAILGMISTQVGSFKRAQEQLEKAVDLYDGLANKNPDVPAYRLDACRALLELGYLFWDENRTAAARRYYERALDRLEGEATRSAGDPAIGYELGVCLARLGGCLPSGTTNEAREKLAIRSSRLFQQAIDQKFREVDSRAGLGVASYRMVWARFDGKDEQALLKSLDAISQLDEAALTLEPASPYLNSLVVFVLQDKSEALIRLGKLNEAMVARQAALAKAREILNKTPDLQRAGSVLADVLDSLGRDLSALQRTADARAAFEESIRITDGLVRRFPDRAHHASRWVDRCNNLADFFEYGPKPQGEIQGRQDLLRTLDLTVERGRALAARFSDYSALQVSFARTLSDRGRYDSDAKRQDQALPYLLEAAEVYRTRVIAGSDPPSTDFVNTYVTTYVTQLARAAACAASLGKDGEVIRMSQFAMLVRTQCTSNAGAVELGNILNDAAKLHRKAGRHAEAVQAFNQTIEIFGSALKKAPWHWFLESNLGINYNQLAETYHEAGDFRNEVLANREYLKIIIGPRYGARIAEYVDPARPADRAEADRIRKLIDQATATGMKLFTVPCDFDGITYPTGIYVTNVPWPTNPLEGQARWLWEERRGKIPQNVMDSFLRVQRIAHENNVSFVELCELLLGKIPTDESSQSETATTGAGKAVAGSPETTAKADGVSLAVLKARLVEIKTKLDNTPDDPAVTTSASELYADYGRGLLKAAQFRESVEAFRESIRLRELLARRSPGQVEPRRWLATTLLSLAQAHIPLNEFDAASACYHRRLDLLEQLQVDAPTEEQRSALSDSAILFGNLAERRGDRHDALRWYLVAASRHASQATRKIAGLLQQDEVLVHYLPEDLKGVYGRVEAALDRSGQAFIDAFAAEANARTGRTDDLSVVVRGLGLDAKGQIRFLLDLADNCRALAEAQLKQSKSGEALRAYLQETNFRETVMHLGSSDRDHVARFAQALLNAAKVSIDLGKTPDGMKLAEKARQFDPEKATFFLASLFEQGNGVPKDPKKAISMRAEFAFNKGLEFLEKDSFRAALAEFERSVKEEAWIDGYRGIGLTERQLGRIDESLASLKKSIGLARGLNECQDIVLDLAETAIWANRPNECFAILQKLEAEKWSTAGIENPYTFERELAGMHAIALHMADRDAADAEKKLVAIVARPNLSSLRSRNIEIDNWLKLSHPSANRVAGVKRVLALLESPVRKLSSPYFPLKENRTWIYKTTKDDMRIVQAKAAVKGKEYQFWLLKTMVNGKVAETEQIAVEPDGIYREASTPSLRKPGVRVLPLPARDGDTWVGTSPAGSSIKATVGGATRFEDVKVPQGEYKGALVAEMKSRDSSGEKVQTVWYAQDVGPVKIVEKNGNGTITWELDQILSLSYFPFFKSGRIRAISKDEPAKDHDSDSPVIVFDRGTLDDGTPYWVYVAVKPSKYVEFMKLLTASAAMIHDHYGEILKFGFEKEVPASVKQEMKEKYGCEDNFREKLVKEFAVAQEIFVRQQEAAHVADVVEMLKKKQGR